MCANTCKNSNLHKAKVVKNDEFYTQLSDVERELVHYREHFRGKTVFCNCDDPKWSAFWRYFHLNFNFLGLKKLVSTHYDKDNPTYKIEYYGGFDNDVNVGEIIPLNGNGDFASPECIEILKESDIVVTNPPFSCFRAYIKLLYDYDKKFIILGNQNAVTYKDIFPLIRDNELWYGYSIHSGGVNFQIPDDYEEYSKNVFMKDGHHFINLSGIRWFTNIDHKQRHEKLILWKQYTPEEYPTYDNYDAINVNATKDIPVDYFGVMGVPITFLDKYNPEQFEIVAFRKGEDGKDLVFTRERERIQPYFRILVRPRFQG
jgi:hypothetical protein